MASLSTDKKSGARRILFLDGSSRRTIRLGKMPKKAAASVLTYVEHLIAARTAGVSIDAETARWLADLPDELHARIARAGLTEARQAREAVTLGGLLAAFDDDARRDVKPSTRTRQQQAAGHLLDYFGADRDAATITPTEADAWRSHLLEAGYARATVSRTVKLARQFFRWAIKRGLIEHNPFSEVKAGSEANPDRLLFVPRATIDKVMEQAPSIQWRCLIALSRYAGLRVPSEAFRLRWADIDWDAGRMFVRSPKTEHHIAGAGRSVPLFPELREHLLAAFEQAEPGTERVLSEFKPGYNPHTRMVRLIRRAGLEPWPRVFHNLRGSRQSELVSAFPIATACQWLGNSRLVAAGHYLTVTDADFQRAVGGGAESGAQAAQITAQHPTAPGRTDSGSDANRPRKQGECDPMREGAAQLTSSELGPGGLEPPLPEGKRILNPPRLPIPPRARCLRY
jgi:integrase